MRQNATAVIAQKKPEKSKGRLTFTGVIGTACMLPLRAIIETCVALRIHPNILTLVGVLVNIGAAWAIGTHHFVLAGVVMKLGAYGALRVAVTLFPLFGPDGLALRVRDCAPRLLITNAEKAAIARRNGVGARIGMTTDNLASLFMANSFQSKMGKFSRFSPVS